MAIVTYKSLGSYGRFANGIFQIMSTIGIARKNGFEFKFPLWINHDHKDRFGSEEDIDIYKHLVNPLPLWTEEQYPHRFIHWGHHDVVLQGNTDIGGHLQSDKYFKHCIDEVRHYLTFKDEPTDTRSYCAVHWRAGDYQDGGRAVYHPRQDIEYYVKAINLMESMNPGLTYCVFSDDWDAAVAMFSPLEKRLNIHMMMVRPHYNYIYAFKCMKSCHSFICANSTYSVAAAILANQPGKKIICPSLWFGDVAGLDVKDIYPENAIII